MSQEIRNLEPKELWNKFADLNAVPRPSKKEDRVIAFMKNFGESLGLETFEDEIRNVIIRKPATAGMENRKPIVMQGHLDMVHQKNGDTTFDFDTQGIDMYVDADWVRALGTTLGADNGLGVAAIMAVLESKTIAHPAIEALFTIDEETGMTGALNLKGGILQGEILLNLDTEEDDEIDIGCAGGIDVTASAEFDEEDTPDGSVGYKITVKGLSGGHSGMDIHKGLGNANKIMNRLLFDGFDNFGLQIASIHGGSLRNAIPRESVAKVIIASVYDEAFVFDMQQIVNEIKTEFKTTEPKLEVVFEKLETVPAKVMPSIAQFYFVRAMYTAHNGVYRMSADFDNLVETSNNIAKVILEDGKLTVQCLTRSSVETSKFDLANALRSAFELMGCEVEFSGAYPGWTPNAQSEILDVLVPIYEKQNGDKPRVVACHAGLECGILGTNYPDMDMISFGPTIHGAHSPDERASISSSQKFWKFLIEILANIPVK
ncbi:MAG: aminoacyl-histidine dipeptidase [Flavobacteriaceae bacterium]|uniref:Aminoacyl-histidine dipeptidase n=1 Tax=Flavobacterium kayseriense TaxID=2764714 RepID=A0ABR7J6D7_9FLAO|nr:aminoacyl-histidine dipeptidase [Flavobacterium kayseriense]MBC5841099.1 aminoacyl-histidine dipeptidase [Flavobacterium kayseriense]MBC5847627.1 aminoacyl-histidine dipeptidase [Flavobacterium kayseriense]MBX9887654.1 aminoacyl-histidine dipeptidase [Flavobacteriaceae bacterium]